MTKEQNSDESSTAKDAEFKISLSSEDVNKIEEKIRNGDDAETQNSNLVSGVALINACTNCGNKFKPVNSMIWELLCDLCLEKNKT